MSWFKVDDTLHSHEKPKRMRRAMRNEAMGLWTFLGSWAAQHETDGFVPDHIIDDFGGTPEVIDALVEAEMWDRESNGVTFRNWSSYQPLRTEKDEERAKTAERVRRYRERQKEKKSAPASASSNGVTSNGETDVYARPDPSRPDPVTTPLNPPEGEQVELDVDAPKSKPRKYTAEFDEAWFAFPADGRKGKPAAAKRYAEARKRASAAEILAGVHRYADEIRRTGHSVKWMQGWLNDDRWADETPLPPRGGGGNRPQAGDTHKAMQRSHSAAQKYRALEQAGYYDQTPQIDMRRTA